MSVNESYPGIQILLARIVSIFGESSRGEGDLVGTIRNSKPPQRLDAQPAERDKARQCFHPPIQPGVKL